jgi:hypothetical protein
MAAPCCEALGLGLSHHSFYTSSEEPPLSIFNSYWDIPLMDSTINNEPVRKT